VLFSNFSVSEDARKALVSSPRAKAALTDGIRAMLTQWGFDPTLVQQADIYVLRRSGDVRVTLPDHDSALAFLGGDTRKPVTLAGQPVMAQRRQVVAQLHTPPPARVPQHGYEILADVMRKLSPKRAQHPPAPPTPPPMPAPAKKAPLNPSNPNASGLQGTTPTPPAGPPPSTPTPPASSPNSDTDVEMSEATSRSRTTEALSPGSSPTRAARRQRVSSPPATPLVLPQHYTSPPASPSLSATQPQDPELDLESTLAPLEPLLSRQ
jgi:hypothetical protein